MHKEPYHTLAARQAPLLPERQNEGKGGRKGGGGKGGEGDNEKNEGAAGTGGKAPLGLLLLLLNRISDDADLVGEDLVCSMCSNQCVCCNIFLHE